MAEDNHSEQDAAAAEKVLPDAGVTREAAVPESGATGSEAAAGAMPETDLGREDRDAAGPDAETESFQSLIRGKYKAEYDASVQKILTARLKGEKTAEQKLAKLQPLLQAAGLTAGKAEGEQEADGGRALARLFAEGEQTGKLYPGFRMEKEMADPQFARLIAAGVPVRTAFEVTHKDEIISGAMRYTAEKVREKLSRSMRSAAGRPVENGASPRSPAVTDGDIRSKAFREEIKARARRGEQVVL